MREPTANNNKKPFFTLLIKISFNLAETILPGFQEFKRGKNKVASIWLIAVAIAYLHSCTTGLIIHSIYIWQALRKKKLVYKFATELTTLKELKKLKLSRRSNSQFKRQKYLVLLSRKLKLSSLFWAEFIQETLALTNRLFLQLKRRPSSAIVGIIQPFIWLILFGALFDNSPKLLFGESQNYLQFLTAGMIVFTAFNGALNGGLAVIFDREFGFLNRLLVAPLASRFSIVLAYTIYIVTLSSLQTFVIILTSAYLGSGFPKPIALGAMILIIFLLVLGVTSLSLSLAFAVAGHIEAIAIIFVINLPVLFASTALVPISYMAKWLSYIASINPLTYAIESIRYLYIYGDLNLSSAILTTPWNDVTFGQALLVLVGFDILAVGIFRPALRRLLRSQ